MNVAGLWDKGADDIRKLKQKLNAVRDREDLAPAEKLHPKLDWANVGAQYDALSYCIEWHDRMWPK